MKTRLMVSGNIAYLATVGYFLHLDGGWKTAALYMLGLVGSAAMIAGGVCVGCWIQDGGRSR